jgi:hypothetical protein
MEVSMTHVARVGALLLVVAGTAGACGRTERSSLEGAGAGDSATLAGSVAKPAELRVSNVMIGRQIGPGNRITEPTFQFAPQDTVYVSVATEGPSEGGTLTAAWRSQSGEILQKSSEPVPPAGENTQFRLSQPKGLKPGTYKVIIFLGSDSVDTRVFAVKK